jgi:hypothetical protein
MSSNFLTFCFFYPLLYFFSSFLFLIRIFYRKAQSMPIPNEAGMEQRVVERHETSFLVLKYFTTSPLFLAHLLFTPFVWSG